MSECVNLVYKTEFYPCGVPPVHKTGEATTRAHLLKLEDAIHTLPELLDMDAMTHHHFAPGLYAREFRMNADDLVVGKIHKHDHLAMLVYGVASVTDEFNKVRMKGPHIWLSQAGVKRAVYAHTDCMFVTFHPTEETDLEKIEEFVIAPSYEALDALKLEGLVCLGEQ